MRIRSQDVENHGIELDDFFSISITPGFSLHFESRRQFQRIFPNEKSFGVNRYFVPLQSHSVIDCERKWSRNRKVEGWHRWWDCNRRHRIDANYKCASASEPFWSAALNDEKKSIADFVFILLLTFDVRLFAVAIFRIEQNSNFVTFMLKREESRWRLGGAGSSLFFILWIGGNSVK